MASTHIKGLDGIRALSVLIVITAHTLGIVNIPGGFGVTVFFFLSGFLITTLLLKEFEKSKKINYKNFMMRRVLRILVPLYTVYFLLLLLNFLGLYPATYTLDGVLSQVFFLTNYYKIFGNEDNLLDGTGIIWSLAVEEHFYILFPLLFVVFVKRKVEYLLYFSVILCLIILGWRYYLSFEYEEYSRFYLATDTRFDSILYGVVLALIMNVKNMFVIKNKISLTDICIIFFSLSGLMFTFLYRDSEFRNTLRYTIQGLSLMPLFYYSVTRPNNFLFSWLNLSVLKIIGLYSYMMYLVHFPIMLMLQHYFNMIDGGYQFIAVLVCTFSVSALSYKYLESPVLKLKNKFV